MTTQTEREHQLSDSISKAIGEAINNDAVGDWFDIADATSNVIAALREHGMFDVIPRSEHDVLQAFYELTVKERDLARYQAGNRMAKIGALESQVADLKRSAAQWAPYMSHQHDCALLLDAHELCSCGFIEVRGGVL